MGSFTRKRRIAKIIAFSILIGTITILCFAGAGLFYLLLRITGSI